MVDKHGDNHMAHYEHGRLWAFRDAGQGCHSIVDLRSAYFAWARAEPGRRQLQWFVYCDIRDGYAIGTNAAIHEKYSKEERESHARRIKQSLE